jgi:hypothetical protein
MKYHKGIKIGKKINIMITDKNSFEECNKEIIEELERHPEINEQDRKEVILMVLS